MNKWIEWKFKGEATSPYDSSDHEALNVNTYNHGSTLSQTLQYSMFEYDGENYYILQVHGGCDIRGGYTTPRVFSCAGKTEWGLTYDQDATVYCEDCGTQWYQYAGYWSSDDSGVELESCKIVKDETEEDFNNRRVIDENQDENQLELILGEGPKFVNTIHVYDGKASCPCCGKGVLS